MITEHLINRLDLQAAQHLANKVRDGRRRAHSSILHCRVALADDRRDMREAIFDQPPTIGLLNDRDGPDLWVV